MDSGETDVHFDGSNWEALSRLITQSQLALLLDSQIADERDQSAWLASRLRGPALDWFGRELTIRPQTLDHFQTFVDRIRLAFGVNDEQLSAHRRGQLEALRWGPELPVFFAEFDRLTSQLAIDGNETRIALVRNKLPVNVQKLLAEQALDFRDYETMRGRLLTMWSLDPHKHTVITPAHKPTKRQRCGRCGKKGHSAPECRSKTST